MQTALYIVVALASVLVFWLVRLALIEARGGLAMTIAHIVAGLVAVCLVVSRRKQQWSGGKNGCDWRRGREHAVSLTVPHRRVRIVLPRSGRGRCSLTATP